MNDLLRDPILGIQTPSGPRGATLPEILAALSSGDLKSYAGQRPHQADVWHVFTVQLAAAILARHPEVSPQSPPNDPAFWHRALLELSENSETAWQLVVNDVTKPAFFQHPLTGPSELKADFKENSPKARTPDELDVLVTAKNHDLKMARIPASDIEAWVYAVVTYQTTSGFLGSGNYGVIRMNGGFANRPIVSMVSNTGASPRFLEELSIIVDQRANSIRGFHYKNNGIVLTWLKPWMRSGHQFARTELDPWFIEAARPLRMICRDGQHFAIGATSKARQIGPKEPDGGDVGDPWIPIQTENKKGRAALSVSGEGWQVKLLCRLLFQEGYVLTPLQEPRKSDHTLWFTGSALVRGQGTTEGFHRIEFPVPPKVQGWLVEPNEREHLARRAQEFIKTAGEMGKALYLALMTLAEGGPSDTDPKREDTSKWAAESERAFNQFWQSKFFPALWGSLEEEDDPAILRWASVLRPAADRLLEDAPNRLPIPTARRYRGICRARGAFLGKLKKSGLLADTPTAEEEVVA